MKLHEDSQMIDSNKVFADSLSRYSHAYAADKKKKEKKKRKHAER